MTVIGITGPTGAGKTTVLRVLEEMGALVLDCDQVYHELTVTCQPMREELAQRFGPEIFAPDGALQRKVLGAMVFDDPKALEDLNHITHFYVHQAVEQAIPRAEAEERPALVVDAIALIESGLAQLCQVTVAVVADPQVRIRRIMARDGIDREYAALRIQAQKPGEYFMEHCDYTLTNNGDTPDQVRDQAKTLFTRILDI